MGALGISNTHFNGSADQPSQKKFVLWVLGLLRLGLGGRLAIYMNVPFRLTLAQLVTY